VLLSGSLIQFASSRFETIFDQNFSTW